MRLRLAQRDAGCCRDVEVTLPAGATVGDLLEVLGAPDAPALATAHGPLPTDLPLHTAPLRDGDAVATDPDGAVPDAGRAVWGDGAATPTLAVVGGPDAGRWLAVPVAGARLGRAPDDGLTLRDPSVSATHAELRPGPDGTIGVRDLGSRNGTRVDGRPVTAPTVVTSGAVLAFGATRCRVSDHPPRRRRPAATPPVGPPPGGPRAPQPPARPPAAPRRQELPTAITTIGLAGIGVPLVLGLFLGWLFSPMFAVFSLLGPAVAGSQWLDERRRQRRDRRTADGAFGGELAAFERDLDRWRARELARLHAEDPDPATLTAWLAAGERGCWSRHGEDDHLLRFRLGTGPGRLTQPDRDDGLDPDPAAQALLDRAAEVEELPVLVDLRVDGGLAIRGPAAVARGVLRAVVLQAAVLTPPSALTIAVVSDRPHRWRDAAWLPHVRAAGTVLVLHPEDSSRLGELPAERPLLLVVDADRLPVPPPRSVSPHVVARVPGVADAPEACGQVLELHPTSVATLRPMDGGPGRRLVADGIGVDVLAAAARLLAARARPTSDEVDGDVDLAELLAPAGLTPEAVTRRWAEHDGHLRVPVGRGAEGPVVLDLARQGPHALVAGATGSGKSELLRSLVLGLAASCPPERLVFLLLDFKGGSAFDVCTALPHTTEVVTDLDGATATRALTCLQAEVRRRERMLRAAGTRDHTEHLRAGGDLPWLVIVVDEFAVLAQEHPDVLGALVDVARRGRSLGIHLVLATQRPSGVVTPEIRANTAIRISLRVEDPADARDVVDDVGPARFPRADAGRAVLRVGGAEPREFRSACAGLSTGRATLRPLLAAPADAEGARGAPDAAPLVRACREAAAATGRAAAPSPLPPPLPDHLPPSALPPSGDGAIVLGLVDRPQRQERGPLRWHLDQGPAIGLGRDAWRVPFAAGVGALARTARDLDLQVLARGPALDELEGWPQTGSLVRPAQWDRLERLLRHLTKGAGRRRTLLLIDDLPALLRHLDDPRDLALRTALETLLLEGHDRGVHVAAGVANGGVVPVHLLGPGALLLAGAGVDRHDAAALGIGGVPGAGTGGVPGAGTDGRVTTGPDGDEAVLVASLPSPPTALLAAETPGAAPYHCPATPAEVAAADVLAASDLTGPCWQVAVGLEHEELRPACLPLRAGTGALVAGPARSGRSSVLGLVAATVRHHRPDVVVTGLTAGRSRIPGVDAGEHVATAADAAARCRLGGRHLLLVDDAELVATAGPLEQLLADAPPEVHLVAAGRNDRLRAIHTGWLSELRRERCGLALRPDAMADGPMWETVLPRRVDRGSGRTPAELIVDGDATRLLVAHP